MFSHNSRKKKVETEIFDLKSRFAYFFTWIKKVPLNELFLSKFHCRNRKLRYYQKTHHIISNFGKLFLILDTSGWLNSESEASNIQKSSPKKSKNYDLTNFFLIKPHCSYFTFVYAVRWSYCIFLNVSYKEIISQQLTFQGGSPFLW